MRRFLLLCLVLFFFSNLSAQDFRFGLSFNAARSKIISNFDFPDDYFIRYNPSGKFGFLIEKKMTKHSGLGMELLWVKIEGLEFRDMGNLSKFQSFSGGAATQTFIISDYLDIHTDYIGVPVYYRYSLGRFSFKGGLQALVLLSTKLDKSNGKSGMPIGKEEPFFHYKNTDNIPLKKYDLGPQIGLDFTLNGHFRLRLDYYHGLMNLYTNAGDIHRKNRQVSFGVDYWFGWESY